MLFKQVSYTKLRSTNWGGPWKRQRQHHFFSDDQGEYNISVKQETLPPNDTYSIVADIPFLESNIKSVKLRYAEPNDKTFIEKIILIPFILPVLARREKAKEFCGDGPPILRNNQKFLHICINKVWTSVMSTISNTFMSTTAQIIYICYRVKEWVDHEVLN